MNRLRAVMLPIATLVAGTGCTGTYPVRQPVGADAREIIVHFAASQELEARTAAGVSQLLSGIQAIRGTTVAVRNDTLFFRIARVLHTPRLQRPTNWQRLSPALTVTLPLNDRELRFEENRYSPAQTAGAIALIVPVVVVAIAMMNASK
jgi:hypothetical protein